MADTNGDLIRMVRSILRSSDITAKRAIKFIIRIAYRDLQKSAVKNKARPS